MNKIQVEKPIARCELCGEPMPRGEEMFKFHGYSCDCPKPIKIKPKRTPSWTMLIIDENDMTREDLMKLPWKAISDLSAYSNAMPREEIEHDILEQVMPFVEDYLGEK